MTAIAELSSKLGSAPAVMVYLNTTDKRLVPNWAKTVEEFKREAPVGDQQATGRKLVECQQVSLSYVMQDLDKQNYVPLRLVVVRRTNGRSIRMALVLVHKDSITGEDRRMQPKHEAVVRGLLSQYYWDERVYRNPGEQGGNFIIDCGRPIPTRTRSAFATLRVSDEKEFALIVPIS